MHACMAWQTACLHMLVRVLRLTHLNCVMNTPESMLAIRVENASRQDSRVEDCVVFIYLIFCCCFFIVARNCNFTMVLSCGHLPSFSLQFFHFPRSSVRLLILYTRLRCTRKRICLATCLCLSARYTATIYHFFTALPPHFSLFQSTMIYHFQPLLFFFSCCFLVCIYFSSLEEIYIPYSSVSQFLSFSPLILLAFAVKFTAKRHAFFFLA